MNNQYSTYVYQFYLITYNQKNLVLRSLDSIKLQVEQFGKNKLVELNIFDDCSTDGAIEVINIWIKQNQKLFNSIYFNSNEINLGIRKNVFNARENISSCKYFFVAGDDELNCFTNVFDYMDYCSDKLVVFSPYLVHGKFGFNELLFWSRIEFFKSKSNLLARIIDWRNILPAPGSYVNPIILHDNVFKDFYLDSNAVSEDYITWKYLFSILKLDYNIYYEHVYNYYPSTSLNYIENKINLNDIFNKVYRSIFVINELIFSLSTVFGLLSILIRKNTFYFKMNTSK